MKLFTKEGCLGCEHAVCDECSPVNNVTLLPIDMVLYCPNCGFQHVDKPGMSSEFDDHTWTNPPHKSHLCHRCGHVWRPADVPTNGVAAITTRGQNDSPLVTPVIVPKNLAGDYEKAYAEATDTAARQIWQSIQFRYGDPTWSTT